MWHADVYYKHNVGRADVRVYYGTSKGKSLGGKGGTKKCVPCSLAADEALSTANEARQRGTVLSSKTHECPYCKCDECKKVWNGSKGDAVVNRDQLAGTLKVTAHQVVGV